MCVRERGVYPPSGDVVAARLTAARPLQERTFIELMTSDHRLKASREGSK